MIANLLGTAARADTSWLTPRNLILAGAAVNGLAILIAMTAGDSLVPLRVVLILTGLGLVLVGVNHRLRTFGEGVAERATTASHLALGSFAVLLAYLASSEEWDTFRLVEGIFVGVGLAGAILVLLPMLIRRALIVGLVLFHFGGILTAVFSVPPPNNVPCWMTGALWTWVYRPYLQFMYLNNAYHFYSPEPGPARQLWFRISYQDPKQPPRWVGFPRRKDFPSLLSYQRYLAMAEGTMQNRFGYPGDIGARLKRRWEWRDKIPYYPDLQADKRSNAWPDLSQYQEPNDLGSKKYIASYARHVFTDPLFKNPDAPDAPIKSVKVYRVTHNFLSPAEMARGTSPDEPSTFLPVYMGEFDSQGNLRYPEDPLLYWVVPILRVPDGQGNFIIKDYVAVHAGDPASVVVDK